MGLGLIKISLNKFFSYFYEFKKTPRKSYILRRIYSGLLNKNPKKMDDGELFLDYPIVDEFQIFRPPDPCK